MKPFAYVRAGSVEEATDAYEGARERKGPDTTALG